MNLNGSVSPHHYRENDKKSDNNGDNRVEIGSDSPKSPKPVAHNISINVTDADSPAGVRRRIHLRSLSDVTPASRAHTPRARSHSERPHASPAPSAGPSPAPSPARPAPSAPPTPAAHATPPVLLPRAVRSERSSPDASLLALDSRVDADSALTDARPRLRERFRSDTVTVLGNPWRKMSEIDLKSVGNRPATENHASLDGPPAADPWIKNSTMRPATDVLREGTAASRGEVAPAAARTGDATAKREGTAYRRGKLERRSAVVCESCGNESCECWRVRSPARSTAKARAARLARGAAGSLGAQCTCEPRSPRPSPARLAPRPPTRALSDDEERPRRLYKSASQKIICSTTEDEAMSAKKAVDPLLETTC